jgi:hypothetical protein
MDARNQFGKRRGTSVYNVEVHACSALAETAARPGFGFVFSPTYASAVVHTSLGDDANDCSIECLSSRQIHSPSNKNGSLTNQARPSE